MSQSNPSDKPPLDPTLAPPTDPGGAGTLATRGTAAGPIAVLPPMQRAGRYRIVSEIGAGGMGLVFRAQDPRPRPRPGGQGDARDRRAERGRGAAFP